MQIFWKKYLFLLLFIGLWFGTTGLEEKTETCKCKFILFMTFTTFSFVTFSWNSAYEFGLRLLAIIFWKTEQWALISAFTYCTVNAALPTKEKTQRFFLNGEIRILSLVESEHNKWTEKINSLQPKFIGLLYFFCWNLQK